MGVTINIITANTDPAKLKELYKHQPDVTIIGKRKKTWWDGLKEVVGIKVKY